MIDTRTAQEDLLKIAQIGGQIGVANDEMFGFVKSVDMAVVALGDEFSGGAEEVSTKLGVLSKVFKETKDLKTGDCFSLSREIILNQRNLSSLSPKQYKSC
jgi:hypothetical protein